MPKEANMIVQKRGGYEIACDGHGCQHTIQELFDTNEQAIEMKHKYGWATIKTEDGYKDLCPRCDMEVE